MTENTRIRRNGLLKEKRGKVLVFRGIGTVMITLFSVVSALLCSSAAWMFDTWPRLSMDELVYQLKAPAEGTNLDMIEGYINFCIPFTVLVLLFILILIIVFRKKRIYPGMMAVVLVISAAALIYTLIYTWIRLDISGYSENQSTYSEFLDNNYVDPSDVQITFPEQKRNLIYIYLESMEITYADEENGGAYEENYIPELTELAQEYEDFSGSEESLDGGYAMPSATWTVAAMFAQSSGLPLSIPIDDNSMDTQSSFLPEVVTIGDILEEAGYSQTLLIGSDATFGGRRLLYTDHGNFDIKDYNYAIDTGLLDSDYRVWWGYEDEKLFEYAKDELLRLSEEDEPFNLTMLTVDTHFEDGYYCELCEDEYDGNQYASVISCSSRQVASFVKWIQRQDFYENTTIVISGDHPTMDSDFCDDVDSDYERKVFTVYINAGTENQDTTTYREYSTFDNFPTTVAALGASIEGNRLGLGTNLFSGEKTLSELYGTTYMESELQKKSALMEELTSEIEAVQDLEIETEEENIPSATVVLDDYDRESNVMSVYISDVQDCGLGISSINVAVWTELDQSDIQWMQAEQLEDGSYRMDVNLPGFNYKIGEYQIAVYMIDSNGEPYMLETVVGHVE